MRPRIRFRSGLTAATFALALTAMPSVAQEAPQLAAPGGTPRSHRVEVLFAEPVDLPGQLAAEGERDDAAPRILRIATSTAPRHVVVMVDLEAAPPSERFRAIPPLRRFLAERLDGGDRITLTLWDAGDDVEILCSISDRARRPALESCFSDLRRRKGVARRRAD
ncbi:MAG: hypothetical protein AAFY88_27965, partial [Acidobacteriota bacterium]